MFFTRQPAGSAANPLSPAEAQALAAGREYQSFIKGGYILGRYIITGGTYGSAPNIPGQQDTPEYPGNRDITTSTYGRTIPLVLGDARLGGNIIFSTPLYAERVGDTDVVKCFDQEVRGPSVVVGSGGGTGGGAPCTSNCNDEPPPGDPCPCGGTSPACNSCDDPPSCPCEGQIWPSCAGCQDDPPCSGGGGGSPPGKCDSQPDPPDDDPEKPSDPERCRPGFRCGRWVEVLGGKTCICNEIIRCTSDGQPEVARACE